MSKRMIVSVALGVFLLFSFAVALFQSSGHESTMGDDSAAILPAIYVEPAQAITSVSAMANLPTTMPVSATSTPRSRLVANYFHATQRCVTCSTIEEYAFETLNTYFSQQIEAEILELRSVDIEQPENAHYIRDYELEYQSLVLVLYRGEKQEAWKNLAEVWQLVHEKEKFFLYVKSETDAMLQEIE
jgi:hypothetical protein